MRRANAASLPSIASPIAVAASLADFTAAALIKYRSFMVCPALSPNLEGGSDAAFFDILTFVSRLISPFSTASNATYNVIIFVREAGCNLWSAFSACKILPSRASITIAAYVAAIPEFGKIRIFTQIIAIKTPVQAGFKSRFVRLTTNFLPHTASFLVSLFSLNQQYYRNFVK
jgi:hypothetical protein